MDEEGKDIMTTTDDKPVIADIATAAIRATWPCRHSGMADFSRFAMGHQLIRPAPSGGVLVMATNGHMLACYHDEAGLAPAQVFVRWPRGLWRQLRKCEPPLDRIIVDAAGQVVCGDATWQVDITNEAEWPPVDEMIANALAGAEVGRHEVQPYQSALMEKIAKAATNALARDAYGTTPGLAIIPSGPDYQCPSVVVAPKHPHVFWLVMPLRQDGPVELSDTCLRFFAGAGQGDGQKGGDDGLN